MMIIIEDYYDRITLVIDLYTQDTTILYFREVGYFCTVSVLKSLELSMRIQDIRYRKVITFRKII